MAWMDVLTNTVETALKAGLAVLGFAEFKTLVRGDRQCAVEAIQAKVDACSMHQLQEFEEGFLNYSQMLFNNDERIRAMELYAVLKLLETMKCGQFQGFTTTGGPIGG